jgi:hypothetical protein
MLLPALSGSLLAQSGSDQWKFKLAPYLMGAAMDGSVTIRDRDIDVDVSAGDIFSNLKFGFMGYFEVKKGPWGFASDTIYMKLGVVSERPSANVDFDQLAWTFLGIREISPWADFIFGARWNRLGGNLDLKNLNIQLQQTKNWIDPVIGIRMSTSQENRVHAALQVDIGGFGAGSDFAWEVFPTAGVNLGRRATLAFGYRWLGIDYKSGSGNQRFAYDVISQGPTIGLALNF